MARLHISNAKVFDSNTGRLSPEASILVADGIIQDVVIGGAAVADVAPENRIDAQGRVVTPGLIDCHVHVTAIDHDAMKIAMMPPSLITAQAKGVMEGMLARGFTTVRDAAGADFGLREAVAKGHFVGPRLFISGWPISQTGGHGDFRRQGMQEMICTCAGLGLFGAIADGEAAVRKAVREQLRNGADQIKVMAGGGVSSPTDPIDGTQYSLGELRAIVEEAEAANTYVLAHAYSPRAITRAVEAGIRTIEHGNLLDEASARAMRKSAAIFVPTLATYAALFRDGERLGWSQEMLQKLERVRAAGEHAIALAKSEGIPVAYGSDLLGHHHVHQNTEFSLRAGVMSPAEILMSATSVAAKVLRQEGRLGVVAPGAYADLLIVDGDPTQSVAVLASPAQSIRFILQAGRIVANRL